MTPESLYPQALTMCAPEPTVTQRKDNTKPREAREQAELFKEFQQAGQDCRDTVDAWSERRAKYVQQYGKETYGFFTRLYRDVTGESKSQ